MTDEVYRNFGLDHRFGHFEFRLQYTAFFQIVPAGSRGVMTQSKRMWCNPANGRNDDQI